MKPADSLKKINPSRAAEYLNRKCNAKPQTVYLGVNIFESLFSISKINGEKIFETIFEVMEGKKSKEGWLASGDWLSNYKAFLNNKVSCLVVFSGRVDSSVRK